MFTTYYEVIDVIWVLVLIERSDVTFQQITVQLSQVLCRNNKEFCTLVYLNSAVRLSHVLFSVHHSYW